MSKHPRPKTRRDKRLKGLTSKEREIVSYLRFIRRTKISYAINHIPVLPGSGLSRLAYNANNEDQLCRKLVRQGVVRFSSDGDANERPGDRYVDYIDAPVLKMTVPSLRMRRKAAARKSSAARRYAPVDW